MILLSRQDKVDQLVFGIQLSYKEELFMDFMKNHIGETESITAKEMSQFGDPKSIRKTVLNLREKGVAVLSCCHGYYLPSSFADIRKTMSFLQAHIDRREKTWHKLEKSYRKLGGK